MVSNNSSNLSSCDSNSQTTNIFHGWYSEKQKKANGNKKYSIFSFNKNKNKPISHIYHNSKGEEIEVTFVSRDLNHGTNENIFDDIQYKGMFVKWVRNIY